MNDKIENNLSMKLSVEKVLNDNKTLWQLIVQFALVFSSFSLKLKQLVIERQVQEKQIKGITQNKANRKLTMCELAVEVSAIVMAYANSINDNELRNLVNYSFSRLKQDRDTRSRDRCLLIYNTALPLEVKLADFGLGDDKLKDLKDAIDSYVELLSAPRTATGERKTSGANIETLIKETDGLLKDSLDLMMVPFKTSNPNFYKNYMSARMVIDLGHRSAKPISVVSGNAINFETEEKIVNAKIYLVGDEKNVVKSDENGAYKIGVYKAGENVLIAEKEGFKKCEEMLFTIKDEDLELNLELEGEEPVVPPVE